MSSDDFGNRMKDYEAVEAQRRFMPRLPILARIDGRAFHTLTRGLKRPYDSDFSSLMIDTTQHLVHETNACIGYTQSDEISLVFYSDDPKSQVFFDGRIQKMTSILAAMTSVKFNLLWVDRMPEKPNSPPTFDCRCWNVPALTEAANTILWREFDATKNSIQMAARAVFSHNELHGVSTGEMQELLFQKGINWNDYPAFFKRGTYIQRRKVLRKFHSDELDKLPEKHQARLNPDLMVERTDYTKVIMPPLAKVTNRVGVIFYGEMPMIDLGDQ